MIFVGENESKFYISFKFITAIGISLAHQLDCGVLASIAP
jgi:hypothetical protein